MEGEDWTSDIKLKLIGFNEYSSGSFGMCTFFSLFPKRITSLLGYPRENTELRATEVVLVSKRGRMVALTSNIVCVCVNISTVKT